MASSSAASSSSTASTSRSVTSGGTTSLSRIQDPAVGLEERLKLLYPRVDETETPLPRQWSPKDKFNYIGLSQNNLRVQYKGHGKTHKDAASVRATHSIPAACGIYYFEVRIISKGRDGYMGVGLSAQGVNMNRLPGWDKHSYGYHGDGGHSFCSTGQGQQYGPTFTTDDVIGCGLNLINGSCFYTKNGHNLGPAFSDLPPNLYPTVGLQTPGEMVDANFGQQPFVFDIEGEMRAQRAKVLHTIETFQTPGRHGDWQVLLHQLVSSYLVHHGFSGTAERFAASTGQTIEEDLTSVKSRQTIQKLVLTGKMGEAIDITSRLYPDLLPDRPSLHFRLRVRQFVEMVSGCDHIQAVSLPGDNSSSEMEQDESSAEPGTSSESNGNSRQKNGNGVSNADARNGNTQNDNSAMEVDVPSSNNTSVLANPDRFEKLVGFGQSLQLMQTEMEQVKNIKDDENRLLLENAFSLMAYRNPKESPVGWQLHPRERELVCRALNSAILESKQLPPFPPLERSLQHTKYLLKYMASVDLGACAFATLEDFIRK